MTTNTTLDLSNVQERVEDTIKSVRTLSRKSAMAYVGLLGMAYDFTMKDSAKWFAKAEKRGERIEKDVTVRMTKLQKQAMHEVESLRGSLEQRVNDVADVNSVVKKLQAGLEKFLRPNGATEFIQDIEVAVTKTVTNVADEAQEMTEVATTKVKKAVKKNAMQVEQVAEALIEAVEKLDLPFEGYDQLTWNKIVGKLEAMDADALVKIREYELANRKRPSILKAIDAKLQPIVEQEEVV